jgi:serine/threonine-protein kinase RsbW
LKPLSVLEQIAFKVNSDLQELDQVLGRFDELNQPWIPKKDWLQCQLALAEGFTNAVRHAQKDLAPEIPIEIQITLTQSSLEMRIWDQGPPFDLEEFLQNLDPQKNHLEGHGKGLLILQRIAAHLSYSRYEDNRNCLLIVKQFSN